MSTRPSSSLKQRTSERVSTVTKGKSKDPHIDTKMSEPERTDEQGEGEPLLGHPGDATQKNRPTVWNLVLGTAIIAQLGVWILFGIIWGQVLSAKPYQLVHAHPLTNAAGLLFMTEAILVVQPTRTQSQKIVGTYWHSVLNSLGFVGYLAGFIIIEYNKIRSGNDHFYSPHAILGLVTYILLILQVLVGLTMFYTPTLFGTVDNAKSLYKYHRASGYLVTVLVLATICAATQVDFNKSTLGIQLWSTIVASVILLVGMVPRIRKGKLGF